MKKILVIFLLLVVGIRAQQENVPLDNEVYSFLKEMNVKGIIQGIHDDSPTMSRIEVLEFLKTIEKSKVELSSTEIKLLNKFKVEFDETEMDESNTYQMFGLSNSSQPISNILSDKMKYIFAYKDENGTAYVNLLGRVLVGKQFEQTSRHSELYDIGFRVRGTILKNLGYSLTVQKGTINGNDSLAAILDSRMNSTFKYNEAMYGQEAFPSYDFTEGFLRYSLQPAENMKLALQLGREKIKFGYGYGSKLVLSGDHPPLDFFRLNFDWGVFSFTSITGSAVGKFYLDRAQDQTKFLAINRFKVNLPNLFEIGIGEDIVYAGRGVDLAYLNPLLFYKFAEMSLQDRDNATLWLDFQTHCFKNFELSGTFFLDEDILSNLQDLSNYRNKTAYQLSLFWYSPFSISDFSFICEYTKIRPYVYSHIREVTNYTSYGQLLGHSIGPNSDEILLRGKYNFNERLSLQIDYQFIRTGKSVYDRNGTMILNAGEDVFQPFREGIDPEHIQFLEGKRINQNIFTTNIKYEPIRKIYLDLTYKLISLSNLSYSSSTSTSYAMFKLMFEI